MSELYSHPEKLLSEHIAEVTEASRIIARNHLLSDTVTKRLDEMVRLHDFGKATRFFQDYIRFKPSPQDWLGSGENRRESKAHSLLGLLAATKIQKQYSYSEEWLLQLGTGILGHHSKLPSGDDVDRRFSGAVKVLIKQLQDLPLEKLEELTGYSFDGSAFSPSEETIFDSMDTCEELFEWLDDLPLSDAIVQRLQTQRLFSILLEADKAFLALSEDAKKRYGKNGFTHIDQNVIDIFLRGVQASPVNELRTQARANAHKTLRECTDKNILTLTLPTGLGKTLTAASLAIELRKEQKRKLIVVLPFLAIVDQTSKVYSDILGKPTKDTLIQSHSLSVRDYLQLEGGDADFFLDTWQSDIVITTFDQVLLALLSSKAKHQMRFHNLCDAVIILDEIQALPTHLWDIVQNSLKELTESFGSTVIAMSATQPGFMYKAQELIPNVNEVFRHFSRYQLLLKHQNDMFINEFIEMIDKRFEDLKTRRVLITLNTRASSRRIYDDLSRIWNNTDDCPIYFLTADVVPIDRLATIEILKNSYPQPCLVISTQVVEAGVDIDMDLVMRDFAPLDSLIQVAGRCNRNNLKPRCDVEFYSLVSEKGKRYSNMVYRKMDGSADISLQETRKTLAGNESILEEDVLSFCEEYFSSLRKLEDLGRNYTKDWAYFNEHIEVSKLLRGKQDNQYQFIVAERDKGADDLIQAVKATFDIEDRWAKRRALRKLAPRIALVTVSIWGRQGFKPESVAYPVGGFWFLRDGFYDEKRGLDLGLGSSDDSSFI